MKRRESTQNKSLLTDEEQILHLGDKGYENERLLHLHNFRKK